MLEQRLKEKLTIKDTAAVLQLNCRRSKHVMLSLFNSSTTQLFSIIAVQEPWPNPFDNLPPNQKGWTLVCPTPKSLSQDDRPQVCLYIRQDLEAQLNPIFSPSCDLAACVVAVPGFTFLIANVYNQPSTFLGFTALDELLRLLPRDIQRLPMICTTDSNLHSPLWNPSHSTSNDKDADRLIELMLVWGLNLRSPKGKPTFGLGSTTTEGTAIDLVWVNSNFDEHLVTCFIDDDDITNHGSDHQAIISIFSTTSSNVPANHPDAGDHRNWNKVCHLSLRSEVAQNLPVIRPLLSREDVELFDKDLREAVRAALDKHSPQKAKTGKHRDWWRPEVLEPLCKETKRLRHLLPTRQHATASTRPSIRLRRTRGGYISPHSTTRTSFKHGNLCQAENRLQ